MAKVLCGGFELEGLEMDGNALKVSAASKTAAGAMKQCAAVAEAAGANPTAAEFKALLDALKAAGIMATA